MSKPVRRAVSAADCEVMGTPKPGATHFTMLLQKGKNHWVSQRTYTTRRDVLQSHLPLELLSSDFVRERWGPGVYKAGWLAIDETGKVEPLGQGRRFQVEVVAAPEPTAPDLTGVENRKRRVKVKLRRGSLKSQLAVLSQLQAMTRESVNAAVGERVAFIQAEAERNREHQREMARLTMRAERDREVARVSVASAPSSNGNGPTADDMTATVAGGIAQIVQKLDAVVEGGGDKSDLVRIGEALAPGFNKIVTIIERVVLDKLEAGPDYEDVPDEPDQPDAS